MRVPRWPPAQPVKLAVWLWLAFALTVWNVVFDRILVIEGREYVFAAATAAAQSAPYVLAEPWMRAAQTRALVTASSVALVIAAIGFAGIAFAVRHAPSDPRHLKSEI